jgi:hypothetical protein
MQAYDPLDYENLARSVVQALLGGPEGPLPPSEAFEGAGVYAMCTIAGALPVILVS